MARDGERKGVGRPALYDEPMLTRSIVLPASLWAWIDAQAEEAGESRAAWMRGLVERSRRARG